MHRRKYLVQKQKYSIEGVNPKNKTKQREKAEIAGTGVLFHLLQWEDDKSSSTCEVLSLFSVRGPSLIHPLPALWCWVLEGEINEAESHSFGEFRIDDQTFFSLLYCTLGASWRTLKKPTWVRGELVNSSQQRPSWDLNWEHFAVRWQWSPPLHRLSQSVTSNFLPEKSLRL